MCICIYKLCSRCVYIFLTDLEANLRHPNVIILKCIFENDKVLV